MHAENHLIKKQSKNCVKNALQVARALLAGQEDTRTLFADALQRLERVFEVADVEDWQLQLDIACRNVGYVILCPTICDFVGFMMMYFLETMWSPGIQFNKHV